MEVYQRLEVLLGKKLPELKLDEETVLILHERVSEAQRLATRELKEMLAAANGRGGNNNKRRKMKGNRMDYRDGGDGDGGMEEMVQSEMKRGYMGGSGGNGGAIGSQRGSMSKSRTKKRYHR